MAGGENEGRKGNEKKTVHMFKLLKLNAIKHNINIAAIL
jgi:hypothetical protein